ncbi:MAG: CBS domain-containing protein [Chitinophagales bacterium]|nr:CBS domain-containing protein [Chitinophagales bacterium]
MNADTSIRTIMTTDLVTVSPDVPAKAIQQIFRENDFHHLPVVERGERLVGIISKEDVFKLSYVLSLQTTGNTYSKKEYETLKAVDIMTKYPVTLDPDDNIGLAADIFLANKFHALPIVEDDQLLGLITMHDLLKFSFDAMVVDKVEETYEE